MTLVYENFTQAALDAAYNNRAHVPQFVQIVERYQSLRALPRRR